MPVSPVHLCGCAQCQSQEEHPQKSYHHYLNLVLSRLDEQQRRWFVALESLREPHPTDGELSLITGMDEKTIRRGRMELADNLQGRPTTGVRRPGAGRPLLEKKALKS